MEEDKQIHLNAPNGFIVVVGDSSSNALDSGLVIYLFTVRRSRECLPCPPDNSDNRASVAGGKGRANGYQTITVQFKIWGA